MMLTRLPVGSRSEVVTMLTAVVIATGTRGSTTTMGVLPRLVSPVRGIPPPFAQWRLSGVPNGSFSFWSVAQGAG